PERGGVARAAQAGPVAGRAEALERLEHGQLQGALGLAAGGGDGRGAGHQGVESAVPDDAVDGRFAPPDRRSGRGPVRLVVSGGGEPPREPGEDPLGTPAADGGRAGGAGGVDGGLHPEALELAAALRGVEGEAVGDVPLAAVGRAVLDLQGGLAGLAGEQGGGAAAAEVERGRRAQLDHHPGQLVEGDAAAVGLAAVHGEQVHLPAVGGEADRGAGVRRLVGGVLRLAVLDQHPVPADRGLDVPAVGGLGLVRDVHLVACPEPGQGGGARVAAEQDRGPGRDGALARLLPDGGDVAVPQADAARLDALVELGERDRRAAFGGGGAVEVHLEHAADAVAADRHRVVVAGDRRLDELAVLDADALGGAGVVDVEEVAVDGGDG